MGTYKRKERIMQKLYQYLDSLNNPYECILFDTTVDTFPVHKHWHYFIEILYIIEGEIIAETDGEVYECKEQDMILFHSKSIHAVTQNENKRALYAVLQFDCNALCNPSTYSPPFRSILRYAQSNHTAFCYFPKKVLQSYPIHDLILDCVKERKRKDYGYDTTINSNLCKLLTYIIRIWRAQGFNTARLLETTKEDSELDHIIEYIDAHSNEVLRVSDLAKRCNMSYSYFARTFKQLYGKSCKEYIEYVKILKTQDMLLFTDFD